MGNPKFETEKKNVTPIERGCSLAQVALQPKMIVGPLCSWKTTEKSSVPLLSLIVMSY
jgi:hypothetical protein